MTIPDIPTPTQHACVDCGPKFKYGGGDGITAHPEGGWRCFVHHNAFRASQGIKSLPPLATTGQQVFCHLPPSEDEAAVAEVVITEKKEPLTELTINLTSAQLLIIEGLLKKWNTTDFIYMEPLKDRKVMAMDDPIRELRDVVEGWCATIRAQVLEDEQLKVSVEKPREVYHGGYGGEYCG